MTDKLSFILKVMIGSALISLGIKYLGPQLAVPATSAVAIAIVLAPPIIMAVLLGWRLQKDNRA
ncbi:MAG: hypothetical protein ACTS2F_20795 [Thainema sp.]